MTSRSISNARAMNLTKHKITNDDCLMNASLNTEQRPTGNCIEFPIPFSFHTAISFSGGEEYLMTSHRGRETKFLDTRHRGIQFAFT